jgi:hypothetical protein
VDDLPFNVAMEEPNARVVGAEAEDSVAVWSHEDSVSPHRGFGKCGSDGGIGTISTGFFL